MLITTDNHLGYLERDHIRGEDSFRAFEEVFEHARRHKADCVLLCGDLFHEPHPSNYTLYRTLEIIRKNCVGDTSVEIECLDNGNFVSFNGQKRPPNYYSKNIKIGLPLFSIHGNHDEPTGYKGVASLDILAETETVNYFGAINSMSPQIEIKPIVLRKGQSLINLYGIGGIRDERIAKLFAEERITFQKEEKGTNILVLHQTRCSPGIKTYLSEDLLSKEMDLVIWGHMHKSIPVPQKNLKMGFYTVQPGSTVQTSLCQAESTDKHCILLKVSSQGWKTETIPLYSTRKLIFKNLVAPESEIEKKIKETMRDIFIHHKEELKPLVRLRIDIQGSMPKTLIPRRVLEEFKDKVANPKEVLRFIYRNKKIISPQNNTPICPPSKTQFLLSVEGATILPETTFTRSILECIEKEDKSVISKGYEEITKGVISVLQSHRWTDIDQEIPPAVKEVEKKLTYLYKDKEVTILPRHSIEMGTQASLPQKEKTEVKDFFSILDNHPGTTSSLLNKTTITSSPSIISTPPPLPDKKENYTLTSFLWED